EVAVIAKRNSPYDVRQYGAIKNRKQKTRDEKYSVKKHPPYADFKMHTQLDPDATHDQQPKHDHEREIEAAEGGRVQERKCKVERAASGQQPDLVTVPHRPNGPQHDLAILLAAREKWMQNANSDIEAIKNHVRNNHQRDKPKPDKSHDHPRTEVIVFTL